MPKQKWWLDVRKRNVSFFNFEFDFKSHDEVCNNFAKHSKQMLLILGFQTCDQSKYRVNNADDVFFLAARQSCQMQFHCMHTDASCHHNHFYCRLCSCHQLWLTFRPFQPIDLSVLWLG